MNSTIPTTFIARFAAMKAEQQTALNIWLCSSTKMLLQCDFLRMCRGELIPGTPIANAIAEYMQVPVSELFPDLNHVA